MVFGISIIDSPQPETLPFTTETFNNDLFVLSELLSSIHASCWNAFH